MNRADSTGGEFIAGPRQASRSGTLCAVARRALLPALPQADAGLLLEGDWPADLARGGWTSLDAQIDGRFAWIDEAAEALAEQAVQRTRLSEQAPPGPADLAALKLRY